MLQRDISRARGLLVQHRVAMEEGAAAGILTREADRIALFEDAGVSQRLSAAQSALSKLNTEYGRKAQDVLTAEQLTRFKESTARKDK